MKFTAAYAVVTVAITATFVAASPTLQARGGQCNTGEINCCNKIAKKTDKRVHGLLSALGIAIEDVPGDNAHLLAQEGVAGVVPFFSHKRSQD